MSTPNPQDPMLQFLVDAFTRQDERLDSIDRTLTRQEGHLVEHMRRSVANERAVVVLAEAFTPVEKDVGRAKTALAVVGWFVGLGVGAFEVLKIVGILK